MSCEAARSNLIQVSSQLMRWWKLRALLKTLPIAYNFTALLIRLRRFTPMHYSFSTGLHGRTCRCRGFFETWSHAEHPKYWGALTCPLFSYYHFFCLKSSHLIILRPVRVTARSSFLSMLICINWPEIYILYLTRSLYIRPMRSAIALLKIRHSANVH